MEPRNCIEENINCSPVYDAIQQQRDNLDALEKSLAELRSRLVGVLTPAVPQVPAPPEMPGMTRPPEMPKSPMLGEVQGMNQRIAKAIDMVESITRRLEV